MHALILILSLFATSQVQQSSPSTTAEERSAVRAQDSHPETPHTDSATQTSPQPLTCTQCFDCCTINQQHKQTPEEKAKADSLDTLTRAYMLATITGVGSGIIVIGVLIWQTKITRTAANAAKDSADVLIKSERSWILTDIAGFQARKTTTPAVKTTLRIQLKCKNQGHSVAWITKKYIRFEIVKEWPETPVFREEHCFDHALESFEPGGWAEIDRTMDADGYFGDGKTALLYGLIKYRDIFGDHETTFGYYISDGETMDTELLYMPGSPKYNKAT